MRWSSLVAKLRSWTITVLATSVILAGVVVGLGKLLLPFADRLQPQLTSYLSERLGQPVQMQGFSAHWQDTGPVFRLQNLNLLNPQDQTVSQRLGQVEFAIDLLDWINPWRSSASLTVLGAQIEISRDASGAVSLDAGSMGDGKNSSLDAMLFHGVLRLEDAQLRVSDALAGTELLLEPLDLLFQRHSNLVTLRGSLDGGLGGDPGTNVAAHTSLRFELLLEGEDLRRGRLHVAGQGLNLGRYQADLGGIMDLEGWISWQGETVPRAVVDFDLRQASLAGQSVLKHGSGSLVWQESTTPSAHTRRIWLALDESTWPSGREWPATMLEVEKKTGLDNRSDNFNDNLAATGSVGVPVWRVAATYLEMEDLATSFNRVNQRFSLMPETMQAFEWQPAGTIRDLRLQSNPSARPGASRLPLAWHGSWQLQNGGVGAPWRLEGINGQVTVSGKQANVVLDAPTLEISAPDHFDQPLVLGRTTGVVNASWADNGWQFQSSRLDFAGPLFAGAAKMSLRSDAGGMPQIDLVTQIDQVEVASTRGYWPRGYFHPDLITWLEQGLLDGEVHQVAAMLSGDLDDWPFAPDDTQNSAGSGRFEVHGSVTDASLLFDQQWPVVEAVQARLHLVNERLEVEIERAATLGIEIDTGLAVIPDTRRAHLDTQLKARGDAGDLLNYLSQTPAQEAFGDELSGLDASGPATVSLQLQVPLEDDDEAITAQGELNLVDAVLADSKWDLELSQVSGKIRFDAAGFSAPSLEASMDGDPVQLSLAVGSMAPEGLHARATLAGPMQPWRWFGPQAPSITSGAADAPETETASSNDEIDLNRWLHGQSNWHVAIDVEAQSGQKRLAATSDLVGTRLDLPEPLTKAASVSLPAALNTPLPVGSGPLAVVLGETLELIMDPSTGVGSLSLGPGGGNTDPMPDDGGFRITGRLPSLDLSGWADLADAMGVESVPGGFDKSSSAVPLSIDLRIDLLDLAGRSFADLQVDLETMDDHQQLTLEAPAVSGELRIPHQDGGAVFGQFKRLRWPLAEESQVSADIRPARIPPLNFLIDTMSVGEVELGAVRLETWPLPDGMNVALLEADAAQFRLRASGDWRDQVGDASSDAVAQRSTFDLQLSSENLGEMLAAFGFKDVVEGGATLADFDVWWPGAPSDFSLASIEGELDVTIGDGRFLNLQPGPGRVFGLLSLNALPRRLSLDFRDVFQEGLAFDLIAGHFAFANGSAWTGDLALTGPSVAMAVEGRTDLDDREYDQQITVVPRVSGALPVVGALAGGPAGAAAAFVLQNLFQGEIDQMARFRYQMRGSWDDPDIRRLDRDEEAIEGFSADRPGESRVTGRP